MVQVQAQVTETLMSFESFEFLNFKKYYKILLKI